MSVSDGIAHRLRAQLAVAAQHFNFLWRLDIAHGIDHRGRIALHGLGIPVAQLLDHVAIKGQARMVGSAVFIGMIAPGFRTRAVGLIRKSQPQPQRAAIAQHTGQYRIHVGERQDSGKSQVALLLGRKRKHVGTIHSLLARTLLRFKQ
jgi:hypothetical protein